MLHVCLILHASRSPNLGVGALTVAQVALLRDLSRKLRIPIHMTLLDWRDSGPACVSGDDISIVPIAGRDFLSPTGVWRHLRKADLVVDIGAGDSFADTYGGKRLRRIFWLKFLTHLARRPLVLAPQTIGPFRHPVSKILARATIGRSALICSRDEASVAHLRDIGLAKDVTVASDVALRLEGAPSGHQSARPTVGINVSGLLMAGGYAKSNQFGLSVDYPAFIRALIRMFLSHPDRPEVHLVPHVISPDAPVEDDMAACAALQMEFPGTVVAPAFQTPSQAKGYIADLSFFTGARMHSCIAALSSGVAVVPFAYSRKFAGLFDALGYRHVADARTHLHEALLRKVLNGFENRDMLAAEAAAATALGRQRLETYDLALSDIIARLAMRQKKPATRSAAGLMKSA
ncbi:polysaccharide pyruvyl transferase family protein [uncultured Litoreibacter sp.]|uniref:polysaccharide pyruvyl transferase family protein n=1 Tax=uncultured Litoreibacter sp. TaxID=1392394 RepID=UPI00262C051C|nr:polysaccharide pyruvyl transferase family protein [uncultured Litoreibacter sp.]